MPSPNHYRVIPFMGIASFNYFPNKLDPKYLIYPLKVRSLVHLLPTKCIYLHHLFTIHSSNRSSMDGRLFVLHSLGFGVTHSSPSYPYQSIHSRIFRCHKPPFNLAIIIYTIPIFRIIFYGKNSPNV